MKGPTPSSSETSMSVWSVGAPLCALAVMGRPSAEGGAVAEAGERGVATAEVVVLSAPPVGSP